MPKKRELRHQILLEVGRLLDVPDTMLVSKGMSRIHDAILILGRECRWMGGGPDDNRDLLEKLKYARHHSVQ